MDNTELLKKLESLKDIHLPKEPSIFNLAIGWWGLILAILLITIFMALSLSKRKKTIKHKDKVISGYQKIINEFNTSNNMHKLAAETSIYLRRITKYVLLNKHATGLPSDEWIDFLEAKRTNSNFNSSEFKEFKGTITKASYDKNIHFDSDKFIDYSKKLISDLISTSNSNGGK